MNCGADYCRLGVGRSDKHIVTQSQPPSTATPKPLWQPVDKLFSLTWEMRRLPKHSKEMFLFVQCSDCSDSDTRGQTLTLCLLLVCISSSAKSYTAGAKVHKYYQRDTIITHSLTAPPFPKLVSKRQRLNQFPSVGVYLPYIIRAQSLNTAIMTVTKMNRKSKRTYQHRNQKIQITGIKKREKKVINTSKIIKNKMPLALTKRGGGGGGARLPPRAHIHTDESMAGADKQKQT